MINESLFLTDGTKIADCYERLVKGGRGNYIELKDDQIILPLFYKFDNSPFVEEKADMFAPYYYHWLTFIFHQDVKVYFQLKTVKYADYKIGHYYISPSFIDNYQEPYHLF